MNKKLIIALVLVTVAVLAGVLTSGASFSGRYHTVEMSVTRLTCGSCVENIRKAVSGLGGTGSVVTDVTAARSVVAFNPEEVDAERIARTISDAGYPATILAVKDPGGTKMAGIDTNAYVARIGSRMISRESFDLLLQGRIQAAETSGQAVPIRTVYVDAWGSLLRQELLLDAAEKYGVSIDETELEQRATEMKISEISDREALRQALMVEDYLTQQYSGRQPNVIEMNNLLNSLYTNTSVDIFDSTLKRNLASGKGNGGCGGGCCG